MHTICACMQTYAHLMHACSHAYIRTPHAYPHTSHNACTPYVHACTHTHPSCTHAYIHTMHAYTRHIMQARYKFAITQCMHTYALLMHTCSHAYTHTCAGFEPRSRVKASAGVPPVALGILKLKRRSMMLGAAFPSVFIDWQRDSKSATPSLNH